MIVDRVPRPLPKQIITSIPPIPGLSDWEDNMKTYGKKLCNGASIASQGVWEGSIWYYDGIRVYYQMAEALIQYYEETQDSRVPPSIKTTDGASTM